jgi:nucleoside-diphosphate-sugar epimerase
MAKHILVTGGAGYIGSVLCGHLLRAGYEITCADRYFFGTGTVDAYKDDPLFHMVRADTRDMDENFFKGLYAVIDLAGLSNDPACDLEANLTESINYCGAVHLAKLAKAAGVPRYIYASSCSVYGRGTEGQPVNETSPCYPVSLYAQCKQQVELELLPLADDNFCVTLPRFATVYGASPRMRFDLIINIMTMFAYTRRKIIVLGGGQQWRPVVHVRDISAALELFLKTATKKINREIINIGSNAQNYRVIEVARHIQDIVTGVEIDIAPDDEDKRSYNVDFSKLADNFGFSPSYDIVSGAKEVLAGLRDGSLDPQDPRTVTSKYYKFLIDAEQTLAAIKLNGRLI